MGGSGAKERRKLQRQKQTNQDERNNKDLFQRQRSDDYRPGRDEGGGGGGGGASRNGGGGGSGFDHQKQKYGYENTGNINNNNNNSNGRYLRSGDRPAKKAKVKAFKKPKHLKRKLEAVVDDDVAKEQLKKELQSFEQTKQKLKQRKRLQSQSLNSVNADERLHDDNKGSDGDGESELEPSFPRGSKENKDSAVPMEGKYKNKEDGIEARGRRQMSVPVAKLVPEEVNDPVITPVRDKSDDENNKSDSDSYDVSDDDDDDDGSTTSGSSSSSDGSNNDDDDDDGALHQETRTRGRRRRGRKANTSDLVQQETKEQCIGSPSKIDTQATRAVEGTDMNGSRNSPYNKKRKTTDGKGDRYCVGRKPVTDFVIGQSYPGKVVYVKKFGVFLDVGCHSDAFCHVSRLSDDFVEKPDDLYKEGDEIPSARIVEIDRKNKRLTVSLQSEARMADEKASIDARRKRREKIEAKKSSKRKVKTPGETEQRNNATQSPSSIDKQHRNGFDQDTSKRTATSARSDAPAKVTRRLDHAYPATARSESEMTPADLKRARKLARRAARREKQGEGTAAPQ